MIKKAVFFDIDGTLWDKTHTIPESAVTAIRALRANGHYAFICSGRTRGQIVAENLLSIGWDGIISGCGTCIEMSDGTEFYHVIPADDVAEDIKTFRRYKMKPILEGRYHLYLDDDEFVGDSYGDRLLAELGDRYRRTISDWEGLWECSKYSCDIKKCTGLDAAYYELSRKYRFIIHSGNFMEVVPVGFDKSTGLKKVCGQLGISVKDSIAVGDATNDLGMLRASGLSVVMGNGNDDAKAVADYITSSINDDGIKNALEYLKLI